MMSPTKEGINAAGTVTHPIPRPMLGIVCSLTTMATTLFQ
jgi:hypothetical protein